MKTESHISKGNLRSGLSEGVSTVDSQVGARDVSGSVTEQEGDGTHEVLWCTHLTDGDQRGPLAIKLWVLVKDLAGTMGNNISISWTSPRRKMASKLD